VAAPADRPGRRARAARAAGDGQRRRLGVVQGRRPLPPTPSRIREGVARCALKACAVVQTPSPPENNRHPLSNAGGGRGKGRDGGNAGAERLTWWGALGRAGVYSVA